jgi:hypothetical protein
VLRNCNDQTELLALIHTNFMQRYQPLAGFEESRRLGLSIFEILVFRALKFKHLVFAVRHSAEQMVKVARRQGRIAGR